ncbi:MAG TPA: ABC transporter permease [Steroidobacteraceae bacterium]|nr:ABC transporter permease [Steroidobacteraceae bacterium]
MPGSHLTARREAEQLSLELSGEWHARQFRQIEAELTALDLSGLRRASIAAGQAHLDLTGAWLLRDFLRRARAAGVETRFADAAPPTLLLVDRTLTGEVPEQTQHIEWLAPATAVEDIGRHTIRSVRELIAAVSFVGHATVLLLRAFAHLPRLRPISVARHVYDTGITAVPIVALIAFLVSVILAYLGAQELQQFGADIFVADLVTIGVLRELGVLLTAVIIAGRSGSAFAAEIGAMQLNEEVDALRAIGVDPIEVLVLPRVLGLMIALPLLTVIADIIGLIGGGLLCHLLLQMPITQYLGRVQGAIASTTFWVGIIKAPVFAAVIALAGCYSGMRVRGSSRELGRLTTLAVVQAIFAVILADALFAVLFLRLNM